VIFLRAAKNRLGGSFSGIENHVQTMVSVDFFTVPTCWRPSVCQMVGGPLAASV
jgi:hypothetical protein